MFKQTPTAPSASTVGTCPTIIQFSMTPMRWKFTQHIMLLKGLSLYVHPVIYIYILIKKAKNFYDSGSNAVLVVKDKFVNAFNSLYLRVKFIPSYLQSEPSLYIQISVV